METNNNTNETVTVDEGLAVNTGIKAGGILLIIGIALIGFNLLMIKSSGRFFVKLTGLGFIAFYVGLGMFLAPGQKVFNSNAKGKEAINDLVSATKDFSVPIWILYLLGGIAACIYTIVCDYWEDILGLFALTVAITAAFFVIKHIIFLITNPAEKMQEKEDGKYAEEYRKLSFLYYPTRVVCVLFIILHGAIMCGAGALYHDTKMIDDVSYKLVGRDTSRDHILVENLDRVVPVRFYQESYNQPEIRIRVSDLDLWEKCFEDSEYTLDEDEMLNIVRLPLSQIICHLAQKYKDEGSWLSEKKITKLQVVDEDGSYSEYSYKNIKRIPEIKKFLAEYEAEDFRVMNMTPDAEEFIQTNFDDYCVFSIPEYTDEYFCLWTLDSFAKFINWYEDEDVEPKSAEEIYNAFDSGYYYETNLDMMTLRDFLSEIVDVDYYNKNGIITDFGMQKQSFLWPDSVKKYYNTFTSENLTSNDDSSDEQTTDELTF